MTISWPAASSPPPHSYGDGFFAFLYPSNNGSCAKAVARYAGCLVDGASFLPWTLEAVVEAIRSEAGGPWVDAFAGRYLAFEKVDALLSRGVLGRLQVTGP